MDLNSISSIKGIIWDWNGTLLDDAHLAVDCMNQVLRKRDLPVLTMDRYQEVFTFPVSDYYQEVGFDFSQEPFEIPAMEFIDQYNQLVWDCSLHEETLPALNYFKSRGMRQCILSAMQQDTLNQCLTHYEIAHFFEQVSGLDDHYANSKLETGRWMISKLALQPHELLLVGDTLHDLEVASALGCPCILVGNGHQSQERLRRSGALVIEDLSQLATLLFSTK